MRSWMKEVRASSQQSRPLNRRSVFAPGEVGREAKVRLVTDWLRTLPEEEAKASLDSLRISSASFKAPITRPSARTCRMIAPLIAPTLGDVERIRAVVLEHVWATDADAVSVDGSDHSDGWRGLKVEGFRNVESAQARGFDDGLGQRMLGVELGGGGDRQHVVFREAARGGYSR